MSDSGNSYELVTTDEGIPTFRHLQTGENLHGQAGPWREAWNLYVGPAQLRERKGSVTIYDVGMGCAAQVLASLDAFLSNSSLVSCEVVSFDLELGGIAALLSALEKFPYAHPHAGILGELLASGRTQIEQDGRVFRWRFVPGDFRESILLAVNGQLPKADLVFYDFFSPKSHPYLWTFSLFEAVFASCSASALLFTYSSATAVRAALAAAGFYVGLGIASGKKAKTTVAAKRISDLIEPLPRKWANTFAASHIPFVAGETPENQSVIRTRIMNHPQFAEPA